MKTVERHRYEGKRIVQTRSLTFEPYRYSEHNMALVMGLIRQNLSPEFLRGRKALMYPDDVLTNQTYGHCYHSAQSLYYLMDTDQLIPMSAIDYREEKHWWLQNGDKIYDVTAEQYYSVGKQPPYHIGKKSRWYGWKERPQQITLNLMVKVLGNRLIKDVVTVR